MASKQIIQDINDMGRLQMLIEVLKRAYPMLSAADQARYADDFAPYLKEHSIHFIYHIKSDEVMEHLCRISLLLRRLVQELAIDYAQEPEYQRLKRVYRPTLPCWKSPELP